MKTPSPLKNLLGDALSRHGLDARVVAAQIVNAANELMNKLLTVEQRSEVQVLSYKLGRLTVGCQTPASRYVVEGLANQLKAELEAMFPDQTLKAVVCQLRSEPMTDEKWYTT